MNKGLALFDGLFIIPVLQVFWTFFSIVSGGIYFQEFNSFAPGQMAGFSLGVFIVFVGVYLLAPGSQQSKEGRSGENYADMGNVKSGGEGSPRRKDSADGLSPLRAWGFSYDETEKKQTRLLSVWAPTTDDTLTEMIDKNDNEFFVEATKTVGQKIKRQSSAFGLGGVVDSGVKNSRSNDSSKKESGGAIELRDVALNL